MDDRIEAEYSDWWKWWLMDGDRHYIVLLLTVLIFLVFLGVGISDPSALRMTVHDKDPIETVFQGLIGAIITGVTLVLTINQLVLSQELGGVADQRERMKGAMDFFENLGDLLDQDVISREPSVLLKSLLEIMASESKELVDELDRNVDSDTLNVEDITQHLNRDAERTVNYLESPRFGSFRVVSAALTFNYSRYLNEVRGIKEKLDALDRERTEKLDRLISLLTAFGTLREHIKTLYFQWDLIRLSKSIIYTGVPALLVSTSAVLFLDTLGNLTGATLGINHLVATVSLLVTLSLLPFLVLVSYVVRISTIAKETLAIGPLSLRDEN